MVFGKFLNRFHSVYLFRLFCESKWSSRIVGRALLGQYRNRSNVHRLLGGTAGSGALLAGFALFGTKTNELSDEQKHQKFISEILMKADAMFDAYLIDMLIEYLADHKDSTEPEILWRLARATCDKAKLTSDKNEKKKLMYEAFEHVKRALEVPGGHKLFAVHKWYAILYNYTGEYEGTRERLQRSFKVKEHLLQATELNPYDATTWHILGVWSFTFADLPWYSRDVARIIFATPPQSSFEEALSYFLKAETIQANFYSQNLLMLAKTYLRMNERDLAKHYLQRTISFVVVSADDQTAHDEAQKILRDEKMI